MAEYTFKQFQEENPNNAAWIMEIQWGAMYPLPSLMSSCAQ
jgi:hypothetical protein